MTETQANAYLRTKVMTASPEELRLMLLDGAIRFATSGRDAMTEKNHEGIYDGVGQCRRIVLELLTTINDDADPELAERVKSVYSFMYTELADLGFTHDVDRMNKVIELLEFERETWVMLMEKVKEEKGEAATSATAPEGGTFSVEA